MRTPLLLVTAGGLARETAAACRRDDRVSGDLMGFLDDDPTKARSVFAGLPVLGPLATVTEHPDALLVICAGKGSVRRLIADRLAALGVTPARYTTVCDHSVYIPSGCVVGPGSILLAGTVLTADVTIGRHVVCMPNVTLTHDDVLEDFATLAAGVSLGGGVHIGEAAYLGMNASVRELRRVGREAVLGMGSVLISDQPADSIWAGVPAQDLGKNKEQE